MNEHIPHIAVIAQAVEARRRLDWRKAAVLFADAADFEIAPAAVMSLCRDSYLCLNRTVEFQNHRAAARKANPGSDFMHDWKAPNVDLVRRLLARPSVEWNRRRVA